MGLVQYSPYVVSRGSEYSFMERREDRSGAVPGHVFFNSSAAAFLGDTEGRLRQARTTMRTSLAFLAQAGPVHFFDHVRRSRGLGPLLPPGGRAKRNLTARGFPKGLLTARQ
jgi:hypothetical protein